MKKTTFFKRNKGLIAKGQLGEIINLRNGLIGYEVFESWEKLMRTKWKFSSTRVRLFFLSMDKNKKRGFFKINIANFY